MTPKLTESEAKINGHIEPALNLMSLTDEEKVQLYALLEKSGWQDSEERVTAFVYEPPEEPVP